MTFPGIHVIAQHWIQFAELHVQDVGWNSWSEGTNPLIKITDSFLAKDDCWVHVWMIQLHPPIMSDVTERITVSLPSMCPTIVIFGSNPTTTVHTVSITSKLFFLFNTRSWFVFC